MIGFILEDETFLMQFLYFCLPLLRLAAKRLAGTNHYPALQLSIHKEILESCPWFHILQELRLQLRQLRY